MLLGLGRPCAAWVKGPASVLCGQGKIAEEGLVSPLLSPALSGSLQEPAKAAPTSPASAPLQPPQPVTPRKNKAAMCKPLMQNRGVSCKTEMKSKGCQTGERDGVGGWEGEAGGPPPPGTAFIPGTRPPGPRAPDWGGGGAPPRGFERRKEGGLASSQDRRC